MASLSRDNGDLNFVFHVYYYTALSITYNISRSISLYHLCSSHKLVHNIDRQNKWFYTLWRHYDVIIILVKFFKVFYDTPHMIIFKPSCHSTLYLVPFSCKLVQKMDAMWSIMKSLSRDNGDEFAFSCILLHTILSNLQYEWSYIPLPFLFFV